MTDFVLTSTSTDPFKARLIACGEVNGLNKRHEELSRALQLKPVVTALTRAQNILDQIPVNFSYRHQPNFSAIDKSEHSVVFWTTAGRPSLVRKISAGSSLRLGSTSCTVGCKH